jgi:hypothetical protein
LRVEPVRWSFGSKGTTEPSTTWTYCRPGTADIGYQSRIQSGCLIHKDTMVPQEDRTERAFTQVRVTPKGMLELVKYFPPAVSVA